MRTKALLSAVAALAVGAITAQAQVYSVNIVGYVNDTYPNGAFKLAANPLDDGTNTLASVIPNLPGGSQAFIWNGSGYTIATRGKSAWDAPTLPIPPGVGFFVNTGGGAPVDVTYVGETYVGPGESTTNNLTVQDLVGSPLPYAGSVTNPNLGLQNAPGGTQVFKWNGTTFDIATRGKSAWTTTVDLNVAEGFFITPGAAFDWVQTLPSP